MVWVVSKEKERMKVKTLVLVLVGVSVVPAGLTYAWKYDVGTNIVNISGTYCRTKDSSTELNVTHYPGYTAANPRVQSQRLYCPIPRRATSRYGGVDSAMTSVPQTPAGSETKVNISSVTVRAADADTTNSLGCFIFGTRMSDQATFYGVTRFLCSGGTGCSFVSGGFNGTNTIVLSSSPIAANLDTVNFGVICDVPQWSQVQYIEATIAPN
jgi:hypothetical protein